GRAQRTGMFAGIYSVAVPLAGTAAPDSNGVVHGTTSEMTYRERKRYRRTHKPSKVMLGLFVVLLAGVVAVLSLAGYVLSVAASAPPLASLKPIDQGTSSAVYAAD